MLILAVELVSENFQRSDIISSASDALRSPAPFFLLASSTPTDCAEVWLTATTVRILMNQLLRSVIYLMLFCPWSTIVSHTNRVQDWCDAEINVHHFFITSRTKPRQALLLSNL